MMLDDSNVKWQIIFIRMALAIEDTTTPNMKRMIERWDNIRTKEQKKCWKQAIACDQMR